MNLVEAMQAVESDVQERLFIIDLVMAILIAAKAGVKKDRLVGILRTIANSYERDI
jgi:hypothetical protein